MFLSLKSTAGVKRTSHPGSIRPIIGQDWNPRSPDLRGNDCATQRLVCLISTDCVCLIGIVTCNETKLHSFVSPLLSE